MTQQIAMAAPAGASLEAVERIATAHDEPAWLRERRAAAWRSFEAMDLPDPGDEEWRRTDVRAIAIERYRSLTPTNGAADASAATDAGAPEGAAAAAGGPFAARVAQSDGGAVTVELTGEARAAGLIVSDLHTAAREHGDLVRQHLGSAVKDDEWKYVALNAATWSGGCFVHVPNDVEVALPVHFTTSALAEDAAVFPRVLIVAGRNSRVTFIDETASESGRGAFVSGVVEIVAGDGAKVAYYSVNRWGDEVQNFNTVRALLGRDAEFVATVAGIGSKLTKMRIDAMMPQPGARAELLGVTFGSGEQHFDYNTRQEHTGDHTISDLQFKSALTDSASLVWYGVTRINPTAGGSEANQTSRNMLLSEHAKAAPIPILEIEAWDVSKCSHGATAGPVDENELFYLQARGVPRAVAEQMLVEGFFADVIDRAPDASLRERITDAVLEKIGGHADGTLTFEEMMAG